MEVEYIILCPPWSRRAFVDHFRRRRSMAHPYNTTMWEMRLYKQEKCLPHKVADKVAGKVAGKVVGDGFWIKIYGAKTTAALNDSLFSAIFLYLFLFFSVFYLDRKNKIKLQLCSSGKLNCMYLCLIKGASRKWFDLFVYIVVQTCFNQGNMV